MRQYVIRSCAVLLACLFCVAAKSDPIERNLDQAKGDYTTAVENAAKDLSSAFDKQISTVSKTGELDSVDELRTQRNGFLISQKMPTAPSMETAAAEYREAVVSADLTLSKAYDTAISGYTKAQQFDDAERVKRMKSERFPSVPLNSAKAGAAVAPNDPILASVKQSKQDFIDTIKAAHTDVLAVINARATAEGDRGNLERYKSLTELYARVKTDIVVPDDVKDTEIRNAGAKFLSIADTAYGKLRASYQGAISDYTKARRIDEAEAVQAELGDGGWFEAYTGNAEQHKLAKIRFTEDMGYTVGTLAQGARTHNNDVVTYNAIPEELVGKDYTLVVARGRGNVRIRFMTSGKVYILQSSFGTKSQVAATLAPIAQQETKISPLTSSGTETWSVWSITAKAGTVIEIKGPVPLVAETLEKANP